MLQQNAASAHLADVPPVHLQSHMEYLLEVAERVVAQKHELKGFKIVKETPYLRHFSADLAPL